MPSITETITGHCYHCDKDTQWAATLGFTRKERVKTNLKTGGDYHYCDVERYFSIDPMLKCTECGELVPHSQWKRYSETGRVVNLMD